MTRPTDAADGRATDECATVKGAAALSAHLKAAHGRTHNSEWKSRIVHGYGYEFEQWHADLIDATDDGRCDQIVVHIQTTHRPSTMANADKLTPVLGLDHLTKAHADLHYMFEDDAHRSDDATDDGR